jgi:hypothetical protein
MKTKFLRENLLIPICTFLGVLLGSVTWLIVYSLTVTEAIDFDGPAALLLGVSLVSGGFILGFASIVYTERKKRFTFRQSLGIFSIFLVTGLLSCIMVGLPIYEYARNKHSHYHNVLCKDSEFCK